MQSSENIKIINTKIRKFNLNIARNIEKNITLKAVWNVDIKTPKADDDRTALFCSELNLNTPEGEDFIVEIKADFIFEFAEKPLDYKDIAQKVCVPMMQMELSEKLDSILKISGYSELRLIEQLNN